MSVSRFSLFLLATSASVAAAITVAGAHDATQDTQYSLRAQGIKLKGAADQRSIAAPARDSVYACQGGTMGAPLSRPWFAADGTIDFAKKPFDEGSVAWSGKLQIGVEDVNLFIVGNGLPKNHNTGSFPVAPSSEAYQYDPNPGSIGSQVIQWYVPAAPQIAAKPYCLPMGPVGISYSGTVIFHALDADLRDAVANETQDACEGHPAPTAELYHVHHRSPCWEYTDAATGFQRAIGIALDGFEIYGPLDVDGNYQTNADLDECHGRESPVRQADGSYKTVYHYVANDEFPYIIGCYKGKPTHVASTGRGNSSNGSGLTGPQMQGPGRPGFGSAQNGAGSQTGSGQQKGPGPQTGSGRPGGQGGSGAQTGSTDTSGLGPTANGQGSLGGTGIRPRV